MTVTESHLGSEDAKWHYKYTQLSLCLKGKCVIYCGTRNCITLEPFILITTFRDKMRKGLLIKYVLTGVVLPSLVPITVPVKLSQ